MPIPVIAPSSRPASDALKPTDRYRLGNQPKTAYACSDWTPKNSAISQPSRVRATAAMLIVAGGSSPSGRSWATRPIHGMIAATASTPQPARPIRQPP